MTYCAVKGCHNSSHNHQKQLKIPFHGFPSDPTVASRWIEKIRLNRKENFWKPTKYTKICSIHFDEKDKYKTKGGLCKLREGAIPTRALHIFCIEKSQESNDVCNDTSSHDSPELDETQMGPSANEASENADLETPSSSRVQKVIETHAPNEPISQMIDSDLESVFDTPRKSALRRQLAKKNALQRKHSKKIKTLQQKARRLKKKNISLQKILLNLRKKRFIDNDVSNILSENVFAAEMYNSLVKKALKNKKRPMPKYTPEFRKFCLTLHFYSPRAYNYVRKT